MSIPRYQSLQYFAIELRSKVFASQDQLACQLNFVRTTITKYETGTLRPAIGYLAFLAQAYINRLEKEGEATSDAKEELRKEINAAIAPNYERVKKFATWDEIVLCAQAYQDARSKSKKASTIQPSKTSEPTAGANNEQDSVSSSISQPDKQFLPAWAGSVTTQPPTQPRRDTSHPLPQNTRWFIFGMITIIAALITLAAINPRLLTSSTNPPVTATVTAAQTPAATNPVLTLIGLGSLKQEAFQQAYQVLGGAGNLGVPFDNGGGTKVHPITLGAEQGEFQDLTGCCSWGQVTLTRHKNSDNVYEIHGALWQYYRQAPVNEKLGFPTSNTLPLIGRALFRSQYGREGNYQHYQRGDAYTSSADGWKVYLVTGEILQRYEKEGGVTGKYGFPLGNEVNGLQNFEGGMIKLDDNYFLAEYLEQSNGPVQISPNAPTKIWVRFKNTGTTTWNTTGDDAVYLRIMPGNKNAASLVCPSWLDSDRVAAVKETVMPGNSVLIEFEVCLGDHLAPGTYDAFWQLFHGKTPMPNVVNGSPEGIATAWWWIDISK